MCKYFAFLTKDSKNMVSLSQKIKYVSLKNECFNKPINKSDCWRKTISLNSQWSILLGFFGIANNTSGRLACPN
jgi:hypothetical protein